MTLLISRASQERDAIVRLRVTRSLARLADPPDPEVRECLAEQVNRDPDPNVLRAAAQPLARHGESDGLMETLCRRARRDSYVGIRLAAVQTLCRYGSPDTVTDVLLECVDLDTDPAVFDAAVCCLTEQSPPSMAVTLRLMRRLADQDPAIRARIAAALGEHFGADPEVQVLLVGLVRDDPALEVRRRAAEQLGASLAGRAEVRELLLRLADDDDWEIRRTALLSLTRHYWRDPRTREVLVRLAHREDDGSVRRLAGQLLATLPATRPDDFPVTGPWAALRDDFRSTSSNTMGPMTDPVVGSPRRAGWWLRGLFGVIGLAALILGYVGFERLLRTRPDTVHDRFDVLYYDLQLFVFGAEPFQNPGPYPWQLQVARFAAPLFTLLAVAEASRLLLAAESRRLRARRAHDHVLVCGDSQFAHMLADRLFADGER